MAEQMRSNESSPLFNWISNGMDGVLAELKQLPSEDIFAPLEAASEGSEEDTKVPSAAAPSDADEESSRKRRYEDIAEPVLTSSRATKPVTKRRKKPNGLPKRPLCAYNYFFQSARIKLQEEMPGIDFEEMGRIVGRRWKQLPEEDREPFNVLAKEDSDRYHEEMEAFKKRKEEKEQKESISRRKVSEREDSDLSQSAITTSNSSPSLAPAHSQVENFQATQGYTASGFSVPGVPNQAGMFWSFQPPVHPNGPGVNTPLSSMGPSAFQPSAYQPSAYPCVPCFPVPPGLEIFLPDGNGRERKYTVQYTYQSMSQEDAEQFMESFMPPTARFPGRNHQHMPPPPGNPRNRGAPRQPQIMMPYQRQPRPRNFPPF